MSGSDYSYGERAEDRHHIRLILAGQDNLASFAFCFQCESEWPALRSMRQESLDPHGGDEGAGQRGQPDPILKAPQESLSWGRCCVWKGTVFLVSKRRKKEFDSNTVALY